MLAALGAAVLVLVAAAATNWTIDPFDKLGRNHIGIYSSSEREAKPQLIEQYPHDGLILGTSRMTYIDPTTIKGYKLFNAAFSGAAPEEILDFLRVYAVNQRLVIVGLDFMTFNQSFMPLQPDPFRRVVLKTATSERPLTYAVVKDWCNYLLSWNASWSSLKTMWKGLRGDNPSFLMPAGNRNARDKLAEDSRITVVDDSEAITFWRTKALADFHYSAARVAVLEQIKQLLAARKIPLIVLITPDNESFIALIHELGLYPVYLSFAKTCGRFSPMRSILPKAVGRASIIVSRTIPDISCPRPGQQ